MRVQSRELTICNGRPSSINSFCGIDTRVQPLAAAVVLKASGKQRAGRAGRVRAGQCWRLYPEAFHSRHMPSHTLAEMIRTPLEELVLQVRRDRTGCAPASPHLQVFTRCFVIPGRHGILLDPREIWRVLFPRLVPTTRLSLRAPGTGPLFKWTFSYEHEMHGHRDVGLSPVVSSSYIFARRSGRHAREHKLTPRTKSCGVPKLATIRFLLP